MPEFTTVLVSVAVSFVFGIFTLFLFGIAVIYRTDTVAHRCGSRPPNVIYNPKAKPGNVQYRGNPWFGWIPWVMSLSYDDMLKGVPGTGTRNGGLTGYMLRLNLDGIVLLRFHALGLRLATFAMLMYVTILLPIYLTATCESRSTLGGNKVECNDRNGVLSGRRSSYERATLNNINEIDPSENNPDALARLYVVVFVSWIVMAYGAHSLLKEWVEILAMRRVYFLEFEHFRERKKELRNTFWKKKSARRDDLDPWWPDPEQRETSAGIALYSVLVGGLPSRPQEEAKDVDQAMNQSRKQNIDWQLAVTRSYFDQCVPNQPGFSSSVAAVTILPGAHQVADAWVAWYTAASKLRRLRFIRKHIATRRQYDIEDHCSGAMGADNDESDEEMATSERSRNIYKDSSRRKAYNLEVLGYYEDEKVDGEDKFLEAIDFGPEQTAAYSREFAQSAAACCPNGCFEGQIERATIDELEDLEAEAAEEVHAANLNLKQARSDMFNSTDDRSKELSGNKKKSSGDISYNEVKSDGNLEDVLFEKTEEKKNETVLLPQNWTEQSIWVNSDTQINKSEQWDLVKILSGDNENAIEDGKWDTPKCNDFFAWINRNFTLIVDWIKRRPKKAVGKVVGAVSRESTYAVVTFTSRQAAVAARQCLADGRGSFRWITYDTIPIPPLADAAACRLCPCRGCCRPVTVNIPPRQKFLRAFLTKVLIVVLCIFFSVPLLFVTELVTSFGTVESLFDSFLIQHNMTDVVESLQENRDSSGDSAIAGLLNAALFSLFFALCPQIFKMISNFGSNASSVAIAEFKALQFYWWFMYFACFWGVTLFSELGKKFLEDIFLDGSDIEDLLNGVATAIPGETSSKWLYWIILRCGVVIPTQYLLQMNTFLFNFFRLNCFARMTRGGGPGGPTPYRIYVDSGVIILCVFALAPAAPIISVAAVVYYLIFNPILRRNLIFMYRPNFDAGGIRWPFLFEMCISCMMVGQVLMVVIMALKQAFGPAVAAAIPLPFTLFFSIDIKKRFLRPFEDAALLQTSLLDGWDTSEHTSIEKREEFRRFLVDAHKAAYVPVCIAGTNNGGKGVITAEPAVVVRSEHDRDVKILKRGPKRSVPSLQAPPIDSCRQRPNAISSNYQYGATMRRVSSNAMTQDLLSFREDGSVRFNLPSPASLADTIKDPALSIPEGEEKDLSA